MPHWKSFFKESFLSVEFHKFLDILSTQLQKSCASFYTFPGVVYENAWFLVLSPVKSLFLKNLWTTWWWDRSFLILISYACFVCADWPFIPYLLLIENISGYIFWILIFFLYSIIRIFCIATQDVYQSVKWSYNILSNECTIIYFSIPIIRYLDYSFLKPCEFIN